MTRLWPNGLTTIPYVTSEYGVRHGLTGTHRGIDTIGYVFVHAADTGRVIYAQYNGTAGYEIRVLTHDGFTLRYLHLMRGSFLVKVGDRVSGGQRLARLGNSGWTSGPHCHFEVIVPNSSARISPRSWIAAGAPSKPGGTSGGSTGGKGDSDTTTANTISLKEADRMYVLGKPGGVYFMVGKKRIHHLSKMIDVEAAEAVFGKRINCDDRQFRVALIGLDVPYSKANAGANWRG